MPTGSNVSIVLTSTDNVYGYANIVLYENEDYWGDAQISMKDGYSISFNGYDKAVFLENFILQPRPAPNPDTDPDPDPNPDPNPGPNPDENENPPLEEVPETNQPENDVAWTNKMELSDMILVGGTKEDLVVITASGNIKVN